MGALLHAWLNRATSSVVLNLDGGQSTAPKRVRIVRLWTFIRDRALAETGAFTSDASWGASNPVPGCLHGAGTRHPPFGSTRSTTLEVHQAHQSTTLALALSTAP